MDRRNFLKLVGLAVVSPSLPTVAAKHDIMFSYIDRTTGLIALGRLSPEERDRLVAKMRAVYKRTKFKPPIRKPRMFFKGVEVVYKEQLGL